MPQPHSPNSIDEEVDLLCTISITLIIDNTLLIINNRVVLLYIKSFVSWGKSDASPLFSKTQHRVIDNTFLIIYIIRF